MDYLPLKVTVLGRDRFDLFIFKSGGKSYIQGLEAGPWLLCKFLRDLGKVSPVQDDSSTGSTDLLFSLIELSGMNGEYQVGRQQALLTINNELSPVKLVFEPRNTEGKGDSAGKGDSDASTTPGIETPITPRSSSESDRSHRPDSELSSNVLVIDDPGGGILSGSEELKALGKTSFVFYQTRCPKASTQTEIATPSEVFNEEGLKEIFIVTDVEDLRNNGISISRNLSWEKAATDTVGNFQPDKFLQKVPRKNWTKIKWIIRFSDSGVIVFQKISSPTRQPQQATRLYFDPQKGESDFGQQKTLNPVSLNAAFMSGFVSSSAVQKIQDKQDLEWENAIAEGLRCVRYLVTQSTVKATDIKPFIEYPELAFGEEIQLQGSDIPTSNFNEWSILKANQKAVGNNDDSFQRMLKLGLKIAKNGIEKSLSNVPIVRFGNIITVDKSEIESYHEISNRVEQYLKEAEDFYTRSNGEKADLNVTRKKPLSIGVFGAPGSGKSFVIKQIIQEITERVRHGKVNKYPDLNWNLSQFLDYSNLLVAFQTIRDNTVSGQVPIVCFDEFDATLNGELGWLKFFLAPMQDGEFFDQGESRPIGHAIFIFIGGTRFTYDEFRNDNIQLVPSGSVDTPDLPRSKHQKTKAEKAARAVKLPDFVSRLQLHLDIQGYDKPPSNDPVYIIRRAILIRSKQKEKTSEWTGKEKKKLTEEEILQLDDSILNDILIADSYKHGARTIDNIFQRSKIINAKIHLDPLPIEEVIPPKGESSQKQEPRRCNSV